MIRGSTQAPRVTLALPALLAALSACSGAPEPVSLGPARQRFTHEDYEKQRERWTRNGKIIRQLDTTLRVHATCFAPEFTAAYVAHQAHVFKLSGEKRAELAKQLQSRWEQVYVFFVAAATMDYDWNDFDSKRSVWNVSLVNDKDEQVAPQKITSESKNNANIVNSFPFVGRFHRVYWFHFPKSLSDGRPLVRGSTKRLSLRFAGPLGHATLSWQLR